jgi:hypothetical protein
MTRAKGRKSQKMIKAEMSGQQRIEDLNDMTTTPVVYEMSDYEILRYAEWWAGMPYPQRQSLGGLCHIDQMRIRKILPTVVQGGQDDLAGMRMSVGTQEVVREARRAVSSAREKADRMGETGVPVNREAVRKSASDMAREVMEKL